MTEEQWCRFIAEIEAGILEPYFVDVPNGHYTKRIVTEEIEIRQWGVAESWKIPIETVEWHYEPCKIPRFKKELRYRRTQ